MRHCGRVIAVGLLATLLFLRAEAEAQITFRNASSSAITFVAASTMVASTTSGGSLTPGIPAAAEAGDLAIVFVAGRPTGTTEPGTPSGWTKRSSSLQEVGSNDLKIITYYRVLTGSEGNPSFTVPSSWSGTSGGMSATIGVWRGADATTPFDVNDVTGVAAAADRWTPTAITTATAGALVVSAVTTSDSNALRVTPGSEQGFTRQIGGGSYDTTTGGNHALGVADKFHTPAGGVTMLEWDQTANGIDAWAGITFALRPKANGLTITKPSGTLQNDVMIASIAVRPETVTITPPSGWTLVRRMNNTSATQSALAVYRKVAGASEPVLYTWSLSGTTPTGTAGGIQTFAGVDTTNPIDIEDGQSTGTGASHATPSVDTTVTNTMLVTSHGVANADTWTPPSGMTEGFDVLAVQIAVEGNWVLQAAVGATGAKSAAATPGPNDRGNAHILALRPSCASVAEADYVAAAAPSGVSASVSLYWSSANAPLVLRKSGSPFAGDHVPAHGTTYTAGQRPWGSATSDPYVIYTGSAGMTGVTCNATGCADASATLSNGTVYYYKVFPKNGTCYASGIGADVNLKPVTGPWSWSYTLAGGSMLKAGIAGEGAIYTGSNASRIVSVTTSNGAQSWAPVATSDAVQGWLTWIFISGGSGTERAVIGGDQSGKVYSINPATGATNWTKDLVASGVDAVQAPVAAQLRALSNTDFQGMHATDLVFVATRNSSSTNNKVFAIRVSDGSVAWTFNGSGTSYQVDYIVGQPWVDRTTNRLYVTSRAGAGAQASLWVISTLNGALEASFPLGHVENSPTLSSSGATLWVANTSGQLYAIDTASMTQKWSSAAALGSAIKGFVWEDLNTAGRLYFTTANGNVWCLQDPGAGPPPNPASPVWKTAVAGASMPLPLDAIYVGSSDGQIHELNITTGVDTKQLLLEATVGDLSTENATEVFAPTSSGKIFRIPLPLP
jgi:hypothetical protein